MRKRSIVVALVVGSVAAGLAHAQVPIGGEALRMQQEQARQALSETEYLKPERPDYTTFNWGGWSSTSYYMFKDDDNSRATPDLFHGLLLTDFRVWAKWVTTGDVDTYIRFRKIHHAYDLGMTGVAPDSSNLDSYDLDVGYIDFPMGEFRGRVGRQLLQTGRGVSLSDNLDAFSLRRLHGAWDLLGFFGRTPPLEDNLDTSVGPAGTGDAERMYGAVQLSHTNVKGRKVYGYALLETDQTRNQNIANLTQPHHYNAQYVGVGASGPIRRKLVGYGEFIRETGRELSQNVVLDPGVTSRDDIDAWAFVSALQYFCMDRHQSSLALEYAMGSGDKDRGNVFNTFGVGNSPGTRDTSFNYFGFYDLGLALSPRLSNIEAWRLGYSIKPFSDRRGKPKEIQLGAKGTLYSKQDALGAISSTTGTRANLAFTDVGVGLDAFTAWRIWSDTSLLVQWGRFIPGSAYSPGFSDPTDRVLVNLTTSF